MRQYIKEQKDIASLLGIECNNLISKLQRRCREYVDLMVPTGEPSEVLKVIWPEMVKSTNEYKKTKRCVIARDIGCVVDDINDKLYAIGGNYGVLEPHYTRKGIILKYTCKGIEKELCILA